MRSNRMSGARVLHSDAWLTIGYFWAAAVFLDYLFQIKEAKAKSFRNVYAKDVDADLERLRTSHLNDDAETEVDKSDLVDGNVWQCTDC